MGARPPYEPVTPTGHDLSDDLPVFTRANQRSHSSVAEKIRNQEYPTMPDKYNDRFSLFSELFIGVFSQDRHPTGFGPKPEDDLAEKADEKPADLIKTRHCPQ
jgi:hypothetical protein